jgi:hypothetical protein
MPLVVMAADATACCGMVCMMTGLALYAHGASTLSFGPPAAPGYSCMVQALDTRRLWLR